MEQIIKELHSIGDFIRWGASEFNKAELFFGHGTDNAIDDAAVLVLHTLNLANEKIPNILWHSRLTSSEKQDIYNILQRRINEAIPTAYLTNEAWFSNLRFYVDSRVLIPRSPIAELIEQGFEPWVEADQVNYMLDLCTGSGCIAIASAMLFPNAKIDAVDISADAVDVAKINIDAYGLNERVNAIQSDLFANLDGKVYDLIVCNPPYVDAEELAAMPNEYHHEPRLGLEAGDNGLLLVEQILRQAAQHLTANGVLIVEVGLSQKYLMEHELPFMWLDFERGGEGVFLLTAQQLIDY
ncbi:50S ribosomal protein L3 N(5)-glutamine methyltransferase [Candidatus Marithrix sp. Canyon 246]|uniref:50S ribosomal protein L3 N(5)-glutamine methyltransferase n=1 Tax=Candidatus Marithrix sp. Canyon 246 TaxID=1827136 RepID=UPI000B17B252|nr:50S ribosomal protein L3 N(5)-glutamine methyltransferase [Candidatus Marithrix sp. Canyon 246]